MLQKFLKMRINQALCQAALVTNFESFMGTGGSLGSGFGIAIHPGIEISALQLASVSAVGPQIQRHEAQMLLAGVTTRLGLGLGLGQAAGSLQVGQANATATGSTSGAFYRSKQTGITVGRLALQYPVKLNEQFSLTFSAARLHRIAPGSGTKWERQSFQTRKGVQGGADLGLTSDLTPKEDLSTLVPDPDSVLDWITTLGVGFSLIID